MIFFAMFFSQSKCFLNIFSLNKSWIWKYWWNSWFATSSESVHGQNYQRANERGINLSMCLEIIKNLHKKSLSFPFSLGKKEDGWTPWGMGWSQRHLTQNPIHIPQALNCCSSSSIEVKCASCVLRGDPCDPGQWGGSSPMTHLGRVYTSGMCNSWKHWAIFRTEKRANLNL